MNQLTSEEAIILYNLAYIWDQFLQLPNQNPKDTELFRHAIHLAQSIIGCRVAYRTDPDIWNLT